MRENVKGGKRCCQGERQTSEEKERSGNENELTTKFSRSQERENDKLYRRRVRAKMAAAEIGN